MPGPGLPYVDARQMVPLRVLLGFLPLLAYAVAARALSWRHWRHAHHFPVMAVLATAFYYVAFAKGTALLLSSVAGSAPSRHPGPPMSHRSWRSPSARRRRASR